MATLLEQARVVPLRKTKGKPDSPELMELALAWLHGEVTTTQCGVVMECSKQNIANNLASVIRRGVQFGRIAVTKKADLQ